MTNLRGNREGRLVCLIGLFLALGTVACYWPVHHFSFINLDDGVYVYEAPMVKRGLTWSGFVWAFKTFLGGNWNPLVWLSHMADCQFFSAQPGGHHVTNLVLHTINVLLVFLVFRGMTGAIWRSALVAAIFAWHPMHVESVAWVAERKDVLSTLFWLAATWAYANYARGDAPRRKIFYGLALFFFTLGLMCKSMLVTLPMVFLLLDYWPLKRTGPVSKLVIEKIPFLVLSLAASAVAVWAQHSVGALDNSAALPVRLENALLSYALYVEKLFWPSDLAVFYPFHPISIWPVAGAALFLAAVTWAVIRSMKRFNYLGVGWFWFLGTLVPVIGIIQVGMQAMADRYTYVPYIGLAVMISWGLGDLAQAWPRAKTLLLTATSLAMACCLAATCHQVSYWQDSTALYHHALKVTTGNYIAHSNLGNMLQDHGQLAEAAEQYKEVIRLVPSAAKPYNNLANVYAKQGKLDDAMRLLAIALKLDPSLAQAHFNMGNAYLTKGRPADAVVELRAAARLNPDDGLTKSRLVEALVQSGGAGEAIASCQTAVQADPTDAHARFSLGWAYEQAKQPEQALVNYKEAVRLAPNSPECLNALAWIYGTCVKAEFRNGPEAVKLATRACDMTKRRNTAMLDTLAAACAEAGRFDEAIKVTGEIRALATAAHDDNAMNTARERLKLYQAGKPYRDTQ